MLLILGLALGLVGFQAATEIVSTAAPGDKVVDQNIPYRYPNCPITTTRTSTGTRTRTTTSTKTTSTTRCPKPTHRHSSSSCSRRRSHSESCSCPSCHKPRRHHRHRPRCCSSSSSSSSCDSCPVKETKWAVLELTKRFQLYLKTCPIDIAMYPDFVSSVARAKVYGPVCTNGACCEKTMLLKDYVYLLYPQYCLAQADISNIEQEPCAVEIVDDRTAIVTMIEVVGTLPTTTVNQVRYIWKRERKCCFYLDRIESIQFQGPCQGLGP